MRAETLHQIMRSVLMDSDKIRYLALIQTLTAAVQKRLSEPAQPAHDEEIKNVINTLLESLKGSATHEFPLDWQKTCHELGLECLLAPTIVQRVDEAFRGVRVDSELKFRLEALSNEIKKKIEALKQISDGFTTIGLKDDAVEPRKYELNITLPRDTIDDRLKGFSNELGKLNKEFQVLSSVVVGEKQEAFKIKSVSSNDFTVVLNIDLNLAEVLAFIFLQIQILLLRTKTDTDHLDKISKNTFSKTLIDSMKQEIKDGMRSGLTALIKTLSKECADGIDTVKLESHKKSLLDTLETLVDRLRSGQFMDVRSGPAQGDGEDEKKIKNIGIVRRRTEKIRNQSAQLKLLQIKDSTTLGITKVDDQPPKKDTTT